MPKTDLSRVRLVARAHYGIRPQAFTHWQDHAPRMELRPSADNTIEIYGPILPHEEVSFLQDCFDDETAISGKMFRERMDAISGDVVLRINCDGGDVFEGTTMISAIRQRQKDGHKVHAIVDGIAASMASMLVAAADTSEISEMGVLMIHEVSGGMYGRADDMENAAKLMRDLNASAAKTYAKSSGMAEDEILKMMDDETYMVAAEAVEKGFVGSVIAAEDDDAPDMKMHRRNERLSSILASMAVAH